MRESLTIPIALPEKNSSPHKGSRFGLLFVRECVPAGAGFSRVTRLHTASVNSTQEALALPWIQKLPGEKQLRFIDGQVFVIQKYANCQLIRAHVCREEERRLLSLTDLNGPSTTKHEMSFEHVA